MHVRFWLKTLKKRNSFEDIDVAVRTKTNTEMTGC